MQKSMPQQDPKKYRGGGGSGGSGGSGGGSDPLQLPKAVFNKSGTRQGMSQGSKRTQIQKGVNIPPTMGQEPKLNRSGNRRGMSKGSRLNQIRKGINVPPSTYGTPDNPYAQPSADKVQNAIKKGMANVKKLRDLK